MELWSRALTTKYKILNSKNTVGTKFSFSDSTDPDVKITFSRYLYEFVIESTHLGIIGIIEAESSEEEDVRYNLITTAGSFLCFLFYEKAYCV